MIKTIGLFILVICIANAVNVKSKIKSNIQADACGKGPCPHEDDYFYTGVINPAPQAFSCASLTSTYVMQCNAATQQWDSSISMDGYTIPEVCSALVDTHGDNCANWCGDQGFECYQAQDNVGSTCYTDPAHERQDMGDNGCNQNWNNQICVCGAPRIQTIPEPEPVVGTDTVLNVVDECVSPGSYEFGEFTGGNPNQVSVIHTQLFTTGFCIPPIVVLGALTYRGGHATTVQLSQTETDFFNTWLQEWDQRRSDKNWHTTETWWYGAFQPGAYSFENGVNWQAGRVFSNDQEWVDVSFANHHFDSAPVVFATPVYPSSDFDWDQMAVGAISDVTSTGFRVKVARRVQDNTGPVDYPSINWFAIEQSEDGVSGTFEVESDFTSIQFGGSDDQLTALFGQAQTFNSERPSQGRVKGQSYSQAKFGLHTSDFDRSNTRIGGYNAMGETMGYFAWRGANTGANTD